MFGGNWSAITLLYFIAGGPAVSGNEAISEEAVRRYLKRRPMTTIDLLKKFRSGLVTGIISSRNPVVVVPRSFCIMLFSQL